MTSHRGSSGTEGRHVSRVKTGTIGGKSGCSVTVKRSNVEAAFLVSEMGIWGSCLCQPIRECSRGSPELQRFPEAACFGWEPLRAHGEARGGSMQDAVTHV